MTRRAKAASSLTRTLQCPAPIQPIWITDTVLTDAYHRFAILGRRHGSNVPGPLESRRRAAKRRNTSWAHHQGGQPPIEPTILFGKESPSGWWQKETAPEKPSANSLLPWWLLSLHEHPQPPEAPLVSQRDHQMDLRSHLRHCKKVEDLKRTIAELGVNLQKEPEAATTIVEHILDSRWPTHEIAKFLTEPSLNVPSINHHAYVLRQLQKTGATRTVDNHLIQNPYAEHRLQENWELLQTALCQAAHLGLISPEALQEVLDELYILGQIFGHKFRTEDQLHGDAYRLLESFEQSNVFLIENVDRPWLRKFSAGLWSRPLNSLQIRLLLRLRIDKEEIMSKKLTSKLLSKLLEDPQRRQQHDVDEAKAVMRCLPVSIQRKILACVTEQIIASIRSGEARPDTFAWWKRIVTSFNGHDVCSKLLSQSTFEGVRRHFTSQLTPQEQLLVATWVMVNICHPHYSLTEISETLSLHDEFCATFSSTSQMQPQDVLGQITLSLRALPFADWSLKDIAQLIGVDWSTYSDVQQPVLDMSLIQPQFSNLANDRLYHDLKKQSNETLVEMCEKVNSDLRTFMNLSRTMIHTNKLAFRVVKRVLKHNAAFKNSLSQSSPDRLNWRKRWDAAELNVIDTAVTGHPAESLPSSNPPPAATLETVDHLAVSFALSRVITARSALLQVYWCYVFLHRYGAPITRAVSRALWHAGVVRCQGNGANPTQVSWIISVVEKVEGKGVARMLLWNSQFREHREEMLESLRQGSGAEVPKELKTALAKDQDEFAPVARQRSFRPPGRSSEDAEGADSPITSAQDRINKHNDLQDDTLAAFWPANEGNHQTRTNEPFVTVRPSMKKAPKESKLQPLKPKNDMPKGLADLMAVSMTEKRR